MSSWHDAASSSCWTSCRTTPPPTTRRSRVKTHPEYYVEGSAAALAAAPYNYLHVETDRGQTILARGRDPNFPGWPDTLQLNYGYADLQRARIDELITIAGKCDGVRCDMAMLLMLLLPEIFQRAWGITPEPFWPKATAAVHAKYPVFMFMAEVYWGLEWTLQQQGFAYCYDKRLYDRLRDGHPAPIRSNLLARLDYQDKLVRFLENHDEPRVTSEFSCRSTKRWRSLPTFRPGYGSFIRSSSRERGSGCRPISAAVLSRWLSPKRLPSFLALAGCVKAHGCLSPRRMIADPAATRLGHQRNV